MFSIRFHGRGGQGVVTAAELLATASSAKTSTHRHSRASARNARAQDSTLLHQADLFAGLGSEGYVLISSAAGSPHAECDEGAGGSGSWPCQPADWQ
jgi:pyruvate ferredoxin oxidoreductase gamma subunit